MSAPCPTTATACCKFFAVELLGQGRGRRYGMAAAKQNAAQGGAVPHPFDARGSSFSSTNTTSIRSRLYLSVWAGLVNSVVKFIESCVGFENSYRLPSNQQLGFDPLQDVERIRKEQGLTHIPMLNEELGR